MTKGTGNGKRIKRVLRKGKKILFRVFGRARWFLTGMILILLLQIATSANHCLNSRIESVQDEENRFIPETGLRNVSAFTINNNGTTAVSCEIGIRGLAAVFDMENARQSYAGTKMVIVDLLEDEYFYPTDFVLADDDILYAVRSDPKGKQSLIKLTKEYSYLGEACSIMPGSAGGSERLSRLNYYDGCVYFAVVGREKVCYYALDTESNSLKSRTVYQKAENGSIAVQILPVDGAFLVFRSDGNVYLTEMDDPEETFLYYFDTSEKSSMPYFTQAVLFDDKICFFDEDKPTKLYGLEEGQLQEILDISELPGQQDSRIAFLDSYRSPGTGEEMLAICLTDGLLTISGETISEKEIRIKIKAGVLHYARDIWEYIYGFFFWGLILHLFLRRKTLFYKQMLVTIPVFLVVTIVIASGFYDYTITQKFQSIRNELEIISEFGAKELEGYDFSSLIKTGADTGTAYCGIYDKLREINAEHAKRWSEDYVFSVVYRTGENTAAILIDEDQIGMPVCKTEAIASLQDFQAFDPSGDYYLSETLYDLLSVQADESGIYAYAGIPCDEGQIYLKVRTDNHAFWEQRNKMVLTLVFYSVLILLLLIAILLLSSLRTTEVLRKAKVVLKRISAGDLSARIRYRSKDELGEICAQVNAMGNSLEESFAEKDRTERFYYCFVPEQFRVLLGKERFTDLELGDSASRELTVLFCDIRPSARISDNSTALENFAFVNQIYGIVGPIIRRKNGFIDKYMGNAIMALFDQADDAVNAGIEIYRAIVSERCVDDMIKWEDVHVGIGIHSGMARIGIVGEEERVSGTVISDTVNLASRLEGLTKQFQTPILISKDSVDRMAAPDALDLRYLGLVQVAGVNEVKSVYEVLDCLPEDERRKRHENGRTLREAVRLFHLGRREETEVMLQKIEKNGNGDPVTEMYYDYVHNLSAEDRGTVFRFDRK